MHWKLENDVDSERREQEKRGIFMPYNTLHITSQSKRATKRHTFTAATILLMHRCVSLFLK